MKYRNWCTLLEGSLWMLVVAHWIENAQPWQSAWYLLTAASNWKKSWHYQLSPCHGWPVWKKGKWLNPPENCFTSLSRCSFRGSCRTALLMRCQQLQLLRVSCYQTSFITIYYHMSLGATSPYFGVFPARHCSSALRLEPKLFATNPFGKRMLWLAADLKQKGFRSDEETGSSLALPPGVKHWHGHTHTHARK